MRFDQWSRIQKRFDVERLIAHFADYSKTVVGSIVASIGRYHVAGYSSGYAVVLYDDRTGCVVRNSASGLCTRVETGVGEMLVRLDVVEASTQPLDRCAMCGVQILSGVFEHGDAYLLTGDLFRVEAGQVLTFVGRAPQPGTLAKASAVKLPVKSALPHVAYLDTMGLERSTPQTAVAAEMSRRAQLHVGNKSQSTYFIRLVQEEAGGFARVPEATIDAQRTSHPLFVYRAGQACYDLLDSRSYGKLVGGVPVLEAESLELAEPIVQASEERPDGVEASPATVAGATSGGAKAERRPKIVRPRSPELKTAHRAAACMAPACERDDSSRSQADAVPSHSAKAVATLILDPPDTVAANNSVSSQHSISEGLPASVDAVPSKTVATLIMDPPDTPAADSLVSSSSQHSISEARPLVTEGTAAPATAFLDVTVQKTKAQAKAQTLVVDVALDAAVVDVTASEATAHDAADQQTVASEATTHEVAAKDSRVEEWAAQEQMAEAEDTAAQESAARIIFDQANPPQAARAEVASGVAGTAAAGVAAGAAGATEAGAAAEAAAAADVAVASEAAVAAEAAALPEATTVPEAAALPEATVVPEVTANATTVEELPAEADVVREATASDASTLAVVEIEDMATAEGAAESRRMAAYYVEEAFAPLDSASSPQSTCPTSRLASLQAARRSRRSVGYQELPESKSVATPQGEEARGAFLATKEEKYGRRMVDSKENRNEEVGRCGNVRRVHKSRQGKKEDKLRDYVSPSGPVLVRETSVAASPKDVITAVPTPAHRNEHGQHGCSPLSAPQQQDLELKLQLLDEKQRGEAARMEVRQRVMEEIKLKLIARLEHSAAEIAQELRALGANGQQRDSQCCVGACEACSLQ